MMFPEPNTRCRSASAGGFTLVEMLAVIGVILILVAIGGVNVVNAIRKARVAKADTQLKLYKAAVTEYHTDTRQYPPSGSEHLYYILGGLSPFNKTLSTRYNPPYYEFPAEEVGRTAGGGDFKAAYDANPDIQIKRRTSPSGNNQPIPSSELFKVSPFAHPPSGEGVKAFPLLDPWGRPIVYISPDDLKKKHNQDTTEWDSLIAVKDEQAYNDKGKSVYIPYGMSSGQFWSAGPDGITAAAGEGSPGLFQPGNLSPKDNRDNDGDGLTDISDTKSKEQGDLAEDDVNSWN